MEICTTKGSSTEEGVHVDLVEAVYLYLTEAHYPQGCPNIKKRAIRKKAQKHVVRSGVLFFKKKKSGRVRLSISRLTQFIGGKFPKKCFTLLYLDRRTVRHQRQQWATENSPVLPYWCNSWTYGEEDYCSDFWTLHLDRNCQGCEANGIEYLVYIYIYK